MGYNTKLLNDLLSDKTVLSLPKKYCKMFNDYISELPWLYGQKLDYEKLPYIERFKWTNESNERLPNFLSERTTLSKYSFVGGIFAAYDDGLIFPYEYVIHNIDILTSLYAAPLFFLVGLTYDNGVPVLHYEDFVEVDGISWVSGRKLEK